jgi:hypothetical protein
MASRLQADDFNVMYSSIGAASLGQFFPLQNARFWPKAAAQFGIGVL